MGKNDFLFSDRKLSAVEQNQRQAMYTEIEKIDPDRLLNTSVDDLVQYFYDKYHIDVPVLDEERLVVDQKEKQIDVSRDPTRDVRDRNEPCYIIGSEIVVEIPFTGGGEAFLIQPNTYTLNPPQAQIRESMLTYTIEGVDLDATRVREQIQRTVSDIQVNLTRLRNDAVEFNKVLVNNARNAIEARRKQILANRNLVAALGYKMKERGSTLKTFVTPEVRKKISPIIPAASTSAYKPEPALEQSDYNHILGVIQGMTQVMELSPSAFSAVNEEALRSHFLVQLNGHYQGQATGETFNYEGKTDILVRSEGRNIFIAECKFWSGSKKLVSTIDQLLSYSSWRDTKTAILIFNRNRDFSRVLATIPEAVRSHPQYKRDMPGSTETVFRYLFANRDDRNRELHLAILAYDVPLPRQ